MYSGMAEAGKTVYNDVVCGHIRRPFKEKLNFFNKCSKKVWYMKNYTPIYAILVEYWFLLYDWIHGWFG